MSDNENRDGYNNFDDKSILITDEEKIVLKKDIHRINHDDLKEEIENNIEKEFIITLYFNENFKDEMKLNAYEFFSLLVKCDVNYNCWFYRYGRRESRLINLNGNSNIIKITWMRQ